MGICGALQGKQFCRSTLQSPHWDRIEKGLLRLKEDPRRGLRKRLRFFNSLPFNVLPHEVVWAGVEIENLELTEPAEGVT
jgi:hypothetical protein